VTCPDGDSWPFEAEARLDYIYELSPHSKRTQHFAIKKVNWSTLFKEIIPIYSKKHMEHINIKCRVTEC
jgi:hypothetical protein